MHIALHGDGRIGVAEDDVGAALRLRRGVVEPLERGGDKEIAQRELFLLYCMIAAAADCPFDCGAREKRTASGPDRAVLLEAAKKAVSRSGPTGLEYGFCINMAAHFLHLHQKPAEHLKQVRCSAFFRSPPGRAQKDQASR